MKKIKILFVDDNSVNIIAAENLMLSIGIQIDKAYDGETAIHMATQEEYEMIFMDLLMPNLDGYMTTKLLRLKFDENNYKTKLIAASGSEMNEGYEESLIGLFEDRIQKPLKLDQLKACLERWIGEERLMRQRLLTQVQTCEGSVDEWNNFIHALEAVKYINIEYYLEFEKKDIAYFMRLIKSSRKQLNQAILRMNETILSGNDKIAYDQLHALKSVLYYVGAHSLASMAEELNYKLVVEKNHWNRAQRFVEIMPNYQVLIERMTILCNELEQALHAYNSSMKNYQENLNEITSTVEEIGKRIEQILYRVMRFEYIEIFNGLNCLMLIATKEMKPYINQSITALEEFEYERVERLLKDCWNEVSVK